MQQCMAHCSRGVGSATLTSALAAATACARNVGDHSGHPVVGARSGHHLIFPGDGGASGRRFDADSCHTIIRPCTHVTRGNCGIHGRHHESSSGALGCLSIVAVSMLDVRGDGGAPSDHHLPNTGAQGSQSIHGLDASVLSSSACLQLTDLAPSTLPPLGAP
jgi:hypothetical protein